MLVNKFAEKYLKDGLDDTINYSDLFVLVGEMKKPIIGSSIKIIEQKLKNLNYSSTLVTRAKLIGVELLDNILKHQLKTPSLSSYFEVSLSDNELKFTSANCISEEDSKYLEEKLNEYDKLTVDEIRDKYVHELKFGKLDEKGNAGVGLLTILKRANKKHEYRLEKIKEGQYYFSFSIKISNAQNN